ncbi:MAG TPA: glycosyltransferase family 4 protein [Actinomycetes bacterium]
MSAAAAELHVVVPEGVDDLRRPSGGNVYDRRVCDALEQLGWSVREHAVAGRWPSPDAAAHDGLAATLRVVPDGGLVLVDGLVASAAPDELAAAAGRLRLVVLVHLPLGVDGDERTRAAERAALSWAVAVVATSRWTRGWLVETYALAPGRVHVARPGVDAAELAVGTPAGGQLLCVAAVTPVKGQDLLMGALAGIADLSWECDCVGALDLDAGFVDRVRGLAQAGGIADRVRFTGPLTGADLDRAYAGADLLVLGSRAESFGMVATEALARGLAVVAPSVGGLAEALGRAGDGTVPGLLVAPGDPEALGAALRGWLTGVPLRERLRAAARERCTSLPTWADTGQALARALSVARLGGAGEPAGGGDRRST